MAAGAGFHGYRCGFPWKTPGLPVTIPKPVGPVDLGVMEDLLNGFKSTTEEILAELFETGTSEGSVEVNTVEELGYA